MYRLLSNSKKKKVQNCLHVFNANKSHKQLQSTDTDKKPEISP